DFMRVVRPIVEGYKDKMSYGFSLGAYNTLYFASRLNCRILALAPRLSIHPTFGKTKVIPKHTFNQELQFKLNKDIAPIIVYDSKNPLDNRFINEGVIPYFTNAQLIKLNYSGHGVAPYLRDMEQLKSFLYAFLKHETPIFNKKLKNQPIYYYLNVAQECFKHKKYRWCLH